MLEWRSFWLDWEGRTSAPIQVLVTCDQEMNRLYARRGAANEARAEWVAVGWICPRCSATRIELEESLRRGRSEWEPVTPAILAAWAGTERDLRGLDYFEGRDRIAPLLRAPGP